MAHALRLPWLRSVVVLSAAAFSGCKDGELPTAATRPAVVAAAQSSPGRGGSGANLLPPSARPYGASYGEWGARWWQWASSLPADAHPLNDRGDCSTGQSNRVWFLGGTFAATPVDPTEPNVVVGEAERRCTVPSGTSLFFPIVNAECSTAQGDGSTESALRACAVGLVDHATNLVATVDGVPVGDLERYRAASPQFTYGPLPANNIFGLPGGTTSPTVSDGYYLMLAPLPVGEHTIRLSGEIRFTQEADNFDFLFRLDIVYHITVVPRGQQ